MVPCAATVMSVLRFTVRSGRQDADRRPQYCSWGCGRVISGMKSVEADGYLICPTCATNKAQRCDNCGQLYRHDDEEDYCGSCFAECEHCNSVAPVNTMHALGTEWCCDECHSDILRTMHCDLDDTGVEFQREVGENTPLADRLMMLRALLGNAARIPVSHLKRGYPVLVRAVSKEMDINRLTVGTQLTAACIERALQAIEPAFEGLQVSVGRWVGAQRLYERRDNLVFRLDVGDVIKRFARDGDQGAAGLLRAAAMAAGQEHPVIPGSTLGWARITIVDGGSTWYVEELQSDFDDDARLIRNALRGESWEGRPWYVREISREHLARVWKTVGALWTRGNTISWPSWRTSRAGMRLSASLY